MRAIQTILFSSFIICSNLYGQVVGTGNGGPDVKDANRERILKHQQKICSHHIENAKKDLKEYYRSNSIYKEIKTITDKELDNFLSYKSILSLIQRKNFLQGSANYYCGQEEAVKESSTSSPLIKLSEELKVLKEQKCHESRLNTPIKLDESNLEIYIERVILMERLNEL